MSERMHTTRIPWLTAGGRRLVLGCILAALVPALSACGASEQGALTASSNASPVASALASSPPGASTAREAVMRLLDMLEHAAFDDVAVLTPRYAKRLAGSADQPLARARLVDLQFLGEPDDSGRVQAQLTVFIIPGADPGPWGDEEGERTLFVSLVRSAEGAWLIDDFGTGP
jgi:hypothetical protein